MRVYRVEHPETGRGPYNGEHQVRRLGDAHWNDTHPSPSEEERIKVDMWPNPSDPKGWEDVCHGDRVCGMTTRMGLYHWFSGWWDALAEAGHKVTEWEVPEQFVSVGRSGQVVFARNKATLVA